MFLKNFLYDCVIKYEERLLYIVTKEKLFVKLKLDIKKITQVISLPTRVLEVMNECVE